jgi:hypothetical protein
MADPKTSPLPPAQYFNVMAVRHSDREFFFDFGQMASGEAGSDQFAHLLASLVTTPRHVKDIIRVLQNSMERYEKDHGEVIIKTPPKERLDG